MQVHLHPSENIPEFSSSTWGAKTEAYYQGLNSVQEPRWEAFLMACESRKAEAEVVDEEYQANISFTDHNHAVLFDFPSPVKAEPNGST